MSDYNKRIADFLGAKKPVGFQTINITSAGVSVLTPPAATATKGRTYYAVMVLENDPAETNVISPCRFREDGTAPTTLVGMPLGSGEKYELQGYNQLVDFKIIGTNGDPLITNKISVTYYQLGDQS